MRVWPSWAAVLLAAGLCGCSLFRRPPVVVASPHYVVGAAYQAGAVWYYPQESLSYDETGLAAIEPQRKGLTADGELVDAGALTASHPTLQLPAILRVTNLENGRQLLVRVNDRGPATPARLLALSRHAAALLGASDGTQIRAQIDSDASQRVAAALRGGALPGLQAAPRAAIQAEALPPPPGASASTRVRFASAGLMGPNASAEPAPVPEKLPDSATQGIASPGQIWIRAGEFGRMEYASQVRARLAGLDAQVQRIRQPRGEVFRVRAGPYVRVNEADSALAQALQDGVSDARIVIE